MLNQCTKIFKKKKIDRTKHEIKFKKNNLIRFDISLSKCMLAELKMLGICKWHKFIHRILWVAKKKKSFIQF